MENKYYYINDKKSPFEVVNLKSKTTKQAKVECEINEYDSFYEDNPNLRKLTYYFSDGSHPGYWRKKIIKQGQNYNKINK